MEKIKKSVLENILKDESSESKLKESFRIFLPTRSNILEKIAICIVVMIPSYWTSHSYSTVVLFGNICDIMLNVSIALFGIIFTGFIFFQALLNDELLVMLIITKTKKKGMGKTKLEEVNTNFVSLMMLYIVAVIIDLVLTVTVPGIPQDFMLIPNVNFCNALSWFLIQLFYMFSAELIWRIVSFIHNIYQLFNAYAVSRIVKLVEIEEEDKKK